MRRRITKKTKFIEFSKRTVMDTRPLLWIVTIACLAMAFLSILRGYDGNLPYITAMVSLPWSAHAVVSSFYLNMAKSDHKQGGITYAKANASNFKKVGE